MGQPGNCGNGIRPYKFSLDELKDLKVGDSKQMEKGCGYGDFDVTNEGNLKEKGFGWPENGEFEFGGRGDYCNLCDGEYGCECNDTNHVPGKRGKVKRRLFKADSKDCCLANMESKDKTKTIGNYTCDPLYRNPGGTECGNYYRDYCKESNNLFNPNCQALKNTNSSLYNQLMTEKCNTAEHYKSSMCMNWCTTNSDSCTMLKTFDKCAQFKITDPDCTEQKVGEVQNLCKKYKIIESDVGDTGFYPCNLNGIKLLEDDCKNVGMKLDSCSPTALDLEKNRLELEKSRIQNAKQFEKTEKTISQVLGITDQPTTTPAPSSGEDYTIYIIAIIIFIILSSSSSSIGGILVFMGGEEAK